MTGKNLLIIAAIAAAVVIGYDQYKMRKAS